MIVFLLYVHPLSYIDQFPIHTVAGAEMIQVASFLRAIARRSIAYESRPCRLGWILYAFCRRSQLPPEATNENS